MREEQWVKKQIENLKQEKILGNNLYIDDGYRLPYSHEILSYKNNDVEESRHAKYQTDILIRQKLDNEKWIPRVIVETKIHSVTTHDAITYSQKALTHKNVHPYLRYGILLGDVASIPGRLIRHGHYFDFMLSWHDLEPTSRDWGIFIKTLKSEIEISQNLEDLLYNTGNKEKTIINRLQRKLDLE